MTFPLAQPGRGLRLFGVGVNIDPSWVMFALFVGFQLHQEYQRLGALTAFSVAILVVLGLSASIFLHEMAHTLVGRAFGMRIDRITLYMFGGVAELHEEPPTAISEFLMALAGPAFSVLAWWLLLQAEAPLARASAPGELQLAVGQLSALNLYLAIFNMIPAFPMDGGRVLRSVIWLITGRLGRATRIAAIIGQGFGILLMLWGAFDAVIHANVFSGLWRIVLGMMLLRMATAGRRAAPND